MFTNCAVQDNQTEEILTRQGLQLCYNIAIIYLYPLSQAVIMKQMFLFNIGQV